VTELRPGLTLDEIASIEREFGFCFADDHRALLMTAHSVGGRLPNWRDGDREQLREMLAWPVEGVLFDVRHNDFWYDGWGERPESMEESLATARGFLLDAPRLIPVYGHRYLPAGRGTEGHPVLSVWQTDIIIYGADLASYLRHEFGGEPLKLDGVRATAAFWKDVVQ
jgi:cell wall assembly regulator SMI1